MHEDSMKLIQHFGRIMQGRVLMAGTKPYKTTGINTLNLVHDLPLEHYVTGWTTTFVWN